MDTPSGWWTEQLAEEGRRAGNMAHILIATASPTQRRDFAATLKAARHHVVTTNDAALTLAVLQESMQPLVVLLDEQLELFQNQGRYSASDVLIHALELPRSMAFDHRHAQHVYILLTQQPPDALPASVRLHVASRNVALLSPRCTIGDLFGAVEDAIAHRKASRTSALARAVLAIAFQQRTSEVACRRQGQRQRRLNYHAAKQGQVIASLQQTASSAWRKLDSGRDAIYGTMSLLRDVRQRTSPSLLPPQSASLSSSMAHMHALQRRGA